MQLTVMLTDERFASGGQFAGQAAKREQYERVNITVDASTAFVVAGVLRAIADDIDPAAIQFQAAS